MSRMKRYLQNSKWFISLYNCIMFPAKKIREHKSRNVFVSNGIDTINIIQTLFTDNDFSFFFDMGTLLGLYRDGRLIKRDMDIDIGVFVNDIETIHRIRNVLIQNNAIQTFAFLSKKRGVIQDAFDYNGIRVDLHYYRHHLDKDVCYLLYDENNENNLVVELGCNPIVEITTFEINDMSINAPKDIEKYLEDRYGLNWRTPDKNYKYWKSAGAKKVDDRGKVIRMK